MLAHDGAWNGQQIVPREWLLEATSRPPRSSALGPGYLPFAGGYGYQLWIMAGERRMFAVTFRKIH